MSAPLEKPTPPPVLSVRSLSVDFRSRAAVFQAVKSVSFDVYAGKTLAIVGESGSGKSAFQKLSHQTFGSLGIATALHQHVENKAVLINGAPKPVFLSTDGDAHPHRAAICH
jgi:ABC-type dipeptide/oligopeptide/nickel transport system ATPase subunit